MIESRVKVGDDNEIRTQILFLVLTGFCFLLLTGLSPKFKSLHHLILETIYVTLRR